MDKPIYIHYGHSDYTTPEPIENSSWRVKPKGGLWASRKDDWNGWKSWCEAEDFRLDTFDRWFEFVLKDGARVLELNDAAQLDDLPKQQGCKKWSLSGSCCLDFEEISKHYDAVEVTDIRKLYFELYGWDCNSIVILNPEVIELI